MKYDIVPTSEFKSTLKLMKKQHKDIALLDDIVTKLANDIPLDRKNKNHALNDSKKYKNCWECHIEPNWLLIYKKFKDKLILVLVATGTHSHLFK